MPRCFLVLLLGALACGDRFALGGARHFEELEAVEAVRAVAAEQARLVQVRDPRTAGVRVGAAESMAPDAAVPASWRTEPRSVVVIANDPVAARRLAARLVREGVASVAVVRGGVEAWLDAQGDRPPSEAPPIHQARRDDRPGL